MRIALSLTVCGEPGSLLFVGDRNAIHPGRVSKKLSDKRRDSGNVSCRQEVESLARVRPGLLMISLKRDALFVLYEEVTETLTAPVNFLYTVCF